MWSTTIMERWVGSCRRELLDRTLTGTRRIWCGRSTSSRSITTGTDLTAPCTARRRCARCRLRSPIRTGSTTSTSTDKIDSVASSASTDMPPDLRGWSIRHPQDPHPRRPQHVSAQTAASRCSRGAGDEVTWDDRNHARPTFRPTINKHGEFSGRNCRSEGVPPAGFELAPPPPETGDPCGQGCHQGKRVAGTSSLPAVVSVVARGSSHDPLHVCGGWVPGGEGRRSLWG
jgi:hypothetical protein